VGQVCHPGESVKLDPGESLAEKAASNKPENTKLQISK
jgi:hypothetical protein